MGILSIQSRPIDGAHAAIQNSLGPTVAVVFAVGLLASGVDPKFALVLSQVVLSLCIPFAVIPLVRMTPDRDLMGVHPNATGTTVAAWVAASLIVVLNVSLLWLTFTGSN